MAVYKVPQDVEADDKLIGPFSFRQFIYLIVVAISMGLAWFLSQLFIGLVVLPLPFIIFFGALALPLRKDQPMETYLLAMIRFYFKPKSRLWEPDGNLSNITITAVQKDEFRLTKEYSSEEADRRLSYLAQVIDTGGWASRGVANPPLTNMTDTYYNEAMHTEDVMDTSATVTQSFDALIDREDAKRKQMVASQFQQAMSQPPSAQSAQAFSSTLTDDVAEQILEAADDFHLESNPYPSSMNQTIIQPLDRHHVVKPVRAPEPPQQQPQQTQQPYQDPSQPFPAPKQDMTGAQAQYNPQPASPPAKPATPQVSSDIMRLANNSSHLTVSALAHEAHRLESKDSEEVVIDLR